MLAAILVLAASIDAIRIESRWGGLGTPSDHTYRIVRRGETYHRGLKAVPAQAVERFAAAIAASPIDRQTALRSIATPEWLAKAKQYEASSYVPVCSAEAKRLFEQHLTDPELAVKLLDHYFSIAHTDDYPSVAVDVTFHDGRKLHIESDAQQALMLPWRVGGVETWNPELARAIAALLAAGDLPRLQDARLATALLDGVHYATLHELDPLEERCLHRDIASATERLFEIVRIYHGSPGDFTAYVRRPDFPPNLVLTLIIRDAEKPGAAAKLDRTVQRLGAYLDVVRPFLAEHSKVHFALFDVDGSSVDAKQVYIFDPGKASRLKAVADGAVRLMEYDPSSGFVSHERFILPSGEVLENKP